MKGVFDPSLLRLASGALGLVQDRETGGAHGDTLSFHVSKDDGQTWSAGVDLGPAGTVFCTHDCALTLSSGRLIMPTYTMIGPTPTGSPKHHPRRFGRTFGTGMACAMSYSFVYYSDDEGLTWQRSLNETFVTLDRNIKGAYGAGEPSAIELKDGRLLMLLRTDLGRHFRSYSEDQGETWQEAEPTDLVCYPCPCSLRRIPTTGDLLVIWTQIAPCEAMQGLYRHRLSCAISKDEGLTWQNHKNLESLDDVSYIEPCAIERILRSPSRQPLDRVRYHRAPGPLRCNEPTCTFIDDTAVITYAHRELGDRAIIEKTYGMDYDSVARKLGFTERSEVCRRWPCYENRPGIWDGNNKVRVLPLDWFYS